MKKLIILCGFISIMNVACAQQMQKTPNQRAEHKTLLLQKQLSLNKEQARKVKVIMLEQAVRIDSLKANRQAEKRNRRLTKRQIIAQTDGRMEKILSADQEATYLKWKELKKAKHSRNGKQAY